MRHLNRPLNNYGFMCDAIFFVCVHVLNFELKIVYCVRSECYQVCCYKNEVNKCEKTLKMYGDVGIAEQQKVGKQAGMMA